jgi:hypothetical protein
VGAFLFCNFVDQPIATLQQGCHVPSEISPICKVAKNAKRRFKIKDISHQGSSIDFTEEIVVEAPERASHL